MSFILLFHRRRTGRWEERKWSWGLSLLRCGDWNGAGLSVDVSRNGFPTWSNYLIERPRATVVLRSVRTPSSAKLFQLY